MSFPSENGDLDNSYVGFSESIWCFATIFQASAHRISNPHVIRCLSNGLCLLVSSNMAGWKILINVRFHGKNHRTNKLSIFQHATFDYRKGIFKTNGYEPFLSEYIPFISKFVPCNVGLPKQRKKNGCKPLLQFMESQGTEYPPMKKTTLSKTTPEPEDLVSYTLRAKPETAWVPGCHV